MTDPRNLLRREGEYWTIAFDGNVVRLRDAKGIRYLARLLERPGERLRAIDLTGDGGGPDPDPAAAERARVNVTRAIGAVRRRIATLHPPLADHLEATLRTGSFCSYRPDPRVPIRWRTGDPNPDRS